MSMTDPTVDALGGLVNLRDLGGLPTEDGVLTRSGVIYRSDAPHEGDYDPEGMPQWPPELVVDLRDSVEQEEQGHPLASATNVRRLPFLEDIREEQEELDEAAHPLSGLYQNIINGAPEKLVQVFRLALEADGPLLIHCAAGKDRTGVAAALLLSAVGVRDDAIVADYVRTDRNMYRVLQRLDAAPELPPGVDEEDVHELISTPTDAIEGVLTRFSEYSDGAAGWLVAHGATEEEIARWRERFLEG